jgi:uncharacterized protein
VEVDVIVFGAGLSGLLATRELTRRGKKVAVVDQESAVNVGAQAFWSFGGIFLVDSPEQRWMGVKDSFELAWSDWSGSASFDRLDDEDTWAAKWARAYVEFAARDKRAYLAEHGITFLPTVGCAERGDLRANGHGNSVPRFQVAWALEPASSNLLPTPHSPQPARGWFVCITATASTSWCSPTVR